VPEYIGDSVNSKSDKDFLISPFYGFYLVVVSSAIDGPGISALLFFFFYEKPDSVRKADCQQKRPVH